MSTKANDLLLLDRLQSSFKEMEMLMKEIQDEYNSPEETKKREEEYQRIQEIGRLRKQAFERGEDMSAYPLPWQTNKI